MSAVVEAMQAVADKLIANGIDATIDPRSATPPCVLVEMPAMRWDVGCGVTGEWSVVALAPGIANLDAVEVLANLAAACGDALPIERGDRTQYLLSPDNPPLFAFRMTFTEGIDT